MARPDRIARPRARLPGLSVDGQAVLHQVTLREQVEFGRRLLPHRVGMPRRLATLDLGVMLLSDEMATGEEALAG